MNKNTQVFIVSQDNLSSGFLLFQVSESWIKLNNFDFKETCHSKIVIEKNIEKYFVIIFSLEGFDPDVLSLYNNRLKPQKKEGKAWIC